MKNIKEALVIALGYCFFGLIWVALSDQILSLLIDDPFLYKEIQTYKGWIYVTITTILIYYLRGKFVIYFGIVVC